MSAAMGKEEEQARLLDPATAPRPRGGRRGFELPTLVVVGALVLALAASFWDGCKGEASEAAEPVAQVASSSEQVEHIMQGMHGGEVPAYGAGSGLGAGVAGGSGQRPQRPQRPQRSQWLPGDAGVSEQGTAGRTADVGQSVGDGVGGEPAAEPTAEPTPKSGPAGAPVSPEVARHAELVERQRFERMQQALHGRSKVMLSAAGDADVLSTPSLSEQAEAFAAHSGGQSYLEKLAALQQAGLIAGEAQTKMPRQSAGDYAQFAGDGEGNRWRLGARVEETPRLSVLAGAVIPATLQTAIRSDLPGPITALVASDVRDSATGDYVLIPQGARLLGAYSADVALGQGRLLVAWQRLIFPDGRVLDIGAMPGTDGAGQAGLADQVDTHFWRMFSSALLMSVVTGGIGLSQGQGSGEDGRQSVGDTMAQSMGQQLGQQLGQLSEETIGRQMDVGPTLTIRPGYRLNVSVTKDLVFEGPYGARVVNRMAGGTR